MIHLGECYFPQEESEATCSTGQREKRSGKAPFDAYFEQRQAAIAYAAGCVHIVV